MQWLKDRFPEVPDNREVYLAPIYPKAGKISDDALLEKIEKSKPKYVFIQLGGGTQERLGLFLKQTLSYKPAIICTGAALAFLSGQQAKIPMWADHLFIGWFLRCIHQPKTFIPRYLKAFKLIYLLFKYGNNHPAPDIGDA
jgi:N-acetylglucosaminyldiphosphoundecaprenol N-acetyl-beta-D-mannosaminyltransferase